MPKEQMSYEDYSTELENQVQALQNKNIELTGGLASTQIKSQDSNLISLQLEITELLQKLERFYRGEYLHTDKITKDVTWEVPKDADQIPLNEYGVTLLMEVVTKYIDKNTILSNYNEERIYEIIADVGDELILVIYCNYEKMGMNTPFKKTKYRLIVTTTLHLIESAYRRAIEGSTFKEINQSRIVTQSDSLGRSPSTRGLVQRRTNILDPRTWGTR